MKVAKALYRGPTTPSSLVKETNLRIEHVSRALHSLEKHEMVECLTPEAKRGRLYKLTEKGKKALDLLSRREEN